MNVTPHQEARPIAKLLLRKPGEPDTSDQERAPNCMPAVPPCPPGASEVWFDAEDCVGDEWRAEMRGRTEERSAAAAAHKSESGQ